MLKKTKFNKGFFAILSSSALYGLYGIFSRFIANGFGNFSQGWARAAIVLVFLSGVLILSPQNRKPFSRQALMWVVPWAALSTLTVILPFIAYNNLPIGTVYFLLYSTMTTGGFLSGKIFFNEKINGLKILSLCMSLIAISLIYSLSIPSSKYFYAMLALLGGLAMGFWNTLSKKFSQDYSTFQVAFADAAVCFVMCFALGLIYQEPLPQLALTGSWFWMILFGLTTVAAVNLLVYGFRHVEAQLGTAIMPTQIVFGAFFGWIVFSEAASPPALVGGLLIFIAAVLPNIRQIFRAKN